MTMSPWTAQRDDARSSRSRAVIVFFQEVCQRRRADRALRLRALGHASTPARVEVPVAPKRRPLCRSTSDALASPTTPRRRSWRRLRISRPRPRAREADSASPRPACTRACPRGGTVTQRRTVGRTVGRVYEDDDFRYNEAGATATTRARGPTVTLGSVVLCALVAAAVALGTGLSSLASPAGADARALASRVTSVSASLDAMAKALAADAKSAAKPAKLDKPAARELASLREEARALAGADAERDGKTQSRRRGLDRRESVRVAEAGPQDADGRALRARREGGGSRRHRRLRLREGGGEERAENGRARGRVRGVCARDGRH